MNELGRTDRVLIAIALLLFLLTLGSLVGFDDIFGGSEQVDLRDSIAEVVDGRGDIRVKFSDQFQWQKGRINQKLVYDDAVFSGENSNVDLRIGQSSLKMDSNTLIVIRQDKQFKSLNLSRGMLSGLVAKNDRLRIESGNGEKIELSANENTKVSIERRGSKTSVKVLSGSIQIAKEGKVQSLATQDKIEFVDRRPRKNDPIQILSPEKAQYYTTDSRLSVDFRWAYSSGEIPAPTDEFALELSRDPTFKRISMREIFAGQTNYSTSLPAPQTLYYRVKDNRGNFSVARKLSLERPEIPRIVMPKQNVEFWVHQGRLAPVIVGVELRQQAAVRLQLAKDSEFKELSFDAVINGRQKAFQLPASPYYARARAEFESDQFTSEWSEIITFAVREKINPLDLKRAQLHNHVIIPNVAYPPSLYDGRVEDVQGYLSTQSPFNGFFQDLTFSEHRLLAKRRDLDSESVAVSGTQFPAQWIYPGLKDLVYHVEGADGSQFPAKSHRLLIEMEAPNQLRQRNGILSWSPILFAEGFDVEVRGGAGFRERFKVDKTWVEPVLAGDTDFAFRVRALGHRGIPISGWSQSHKFRTPKPAPEIIQSENLKVDDNKSKNLRAERKPAQDQKAMVRVRKEKKDDPTLWEKIGGWLWGGSGFNFVNVRQTISNTADVEYKNSKGPSAYLEAGWMSRSKFGAVVSYKRTPGEITIANYPVNKREFVWTTSSMEGLWAVPWRMKLFNIPILWTARAGLQNHYFPFLYVETGNELIQATNNMLTGTIGFLSETMTKKLKYYWSMRYQQPLSSGSEGGNSFAITPIIAFDGSIGASYSFNPRWKAGAFWYGQLHSYQFNYQSPTQSNSGVQNLFYSNMELRLGVDF